MKIVMAAGGTGGHIYPAIALANSFKNNKDDIYFIGSNFRMEKDVITNTEFPFYGLDIYNFSNKIKGIYSLFKSYFKCKKILREINADVVIGYGNYITLPVILAAKKLNIKTIIHEQNAFPGKANLFLSKYVDYIIGSYELNKQYFDNNKLYIYGNPRASECKNYNKDNTFIKDIGLNNNLNTVLIFMGSLGSSSMNNIFIELLSLYKDSDTQFIFVTGINQYIDINDKFKNYNNIRILDKCDGIKALDACTLAITRAGATTLSELAALNKAAIVIPSPYVPDNGQLLNAKVYNEKQAIILLEEKEININKFKDIIDEVINDKEKITKLEQNINEFNYSNASYDIINLVKKG